MGKKVKNKFKLTGANARNQNESSEEHRNNHFLLSFTVFHSLFAVVCTSVIIKRNQ